MKIMSLEFRLTLLEEQLIPRPLKDGWEKTQSVKLIPELVDKISSKNVLSGFSVLFLCFLTGAVVMKKPEVIAIFSICLILIFLGLMAYHLYDDPFLIHLDTLRGLLGSKTMGHFLVNFYKEDVLRAACEEKLVWLARRVKMFEKEKGINSNEACVARQDFERNWILLRRFDLAEPIYNPYYDKVDELEKKKHEHQENRAETEKAAELVRYFL